MIKKFFIPLIVLGSIAGYHYREQLKDFIPPTTQQEQKQVTEQREVPEVLSEEKETPELLPLTVTDASLEQVTTNISEPKQTPATPLTEELEEKPAIKPFHKKRPKNVLRTWTNVKGKTFKGTFINFSEGYVSILRERDRRVFKLFYTSLSQGDLDFIKKVDFQIGDQNPEFDESKFDPNYPQMQIWREAGVQAGIPHLIEQLQHVNKVFTHQHSIEEINSYLTQTSSSNDPVVVLLKNGIYHLKDTRLNIPSNTTMVGESRDGVEIYISGTARINLGKAQHSGLRNLSIIGKWKQTPPDSTFFDADLPGDLIKHTMVHMPDCHHSFVDNVRIINSASHPVWSWGSHNTFRNLDIDGSYCKGGGCQGYFFIGGEQTLITGCKVTRLRHISMQGQSSKNNVFYGNDIRQEFSFHADDGGDNLIENNTITLPKEMPPRYRAIMGPWSYQHKIGGLNFIYNNRCLEENHQKKTPWSDSKLYVGPHYILKGDVDPYEVFSPIEKEYPIGNTLYPIIIPE